MVKVYRNLRNKCYSLKRGKDPVEHYDVILLKNCTFKVYESGRQRVLRDKQKNVHAYVIGEIDHAYISDLDRSQQAYYDPYKYNSFVDKETKKPIYSARWVLLDNTGVYYG